MRPCYRYQELNALIERVMASMLWRQFSGLILILHSSGAAENMKKPVFSAGYACGFGLKKAEKGP